MLKRYCDVLRWMFYFSMYGKMRPILIAILWYQLDVFEGSVFKFTGMTGAGKHPVW